MEIAFPILMAVAVATAITGALLLFRPPRRRVEVAHTDLWQAAIEQVGPRRVVRRPPFGPMLVALGGLLLAGSAGGWHMLGQRQSPPEILVAIADTPHLHAVDANGTRQIAALQARLTQLLRTLDPDTPTRMVVLGTPAALDDAETRPAEQWLDRMDAAVASLEGYYAVPAVSDVVALRGDRARVYLLGEFSGRPTSEDVQWAFRPTPPADDVGLAAAAYEGGQLFVGVRRFAGSDERVSVAANSVDESDARTELIRGTVDIGPNARGRAVVNLTPPAGRAIEVRIADTDGQPLNDAMRLRPTGRAGATVRIVGRPNAYLSRAVEANDRLSFAGDATGDWLIVNESTHTAQAAAGQGLVLIDPLTPPGGVTFTTPVADAGIAAQSGEAPWNTVNLSGVAVARATGATLDAPWLAVARDQAGRPMIAWHAGRRQILVLFSLAPSNTDWPAHPSWPLFWDLLADLGDAAGPTAWQAGEWPFARAVGGGHPADLFTLPDAGSVAAINSAAIAAPEMAPSPAGLAIWPMAAGAGLLCLAGGWWITDRRRLTASHGGG